MSPCIIDKFGFRNAVLEWAVSEQLHHISIHQFSKLALCEILEQDIRL
jgi:hypothetical protein